MPETSATSAYLTSPRTTHQGSATPIYDALYAEYQRLFRTLPGDRAGEEELRFEYFDRVHGFHAGSRGGDPPRRHARALPAALPPAPRDGERYGS
jgi:hypothetical protein